MAELEVERLTKRYGPTLALNELSLTVEKGEFVSLLGPSGCGKTTALRIIAGFIRPNAGIVRIDGKITNDIPPHHRDIGIVFQNYALFPHLTVKQNVEFGLKMRKVPAKESAERVGRAIELVRLSGLEHRYPSQLSGGQQQRVAVARAVVINPTVLLLDEPLSNLDAKLRVSTRDELRRLQRELGVTTIFVTHDQEEALTISDRVAVMQSGHLEQVGTPEELYNRPRTPFVAGFIGTSNMLAGTVRGVSGSIASILIEETGMAVNAHIPAGDPTPPTGATIVVLIRPEQIVLRRTDDPSSSGNTYTGRIIAPVFVGSVMRYQVQIDNGPLVLVEVPNIGGDRWRQDDLVQVGWSPENTVVIPPVDGAA